MNAEIVSYHCSPAEWETMRLLLGLNPPVGLSDIQLDEDTCRATYDSLVDDGLLTPCGDQVIVDRLFALLLTEASRADICLAVRGETRQLLLYRTPQMILLSEWTLARCTLTPLPGPAAAHGPLTAALKRCQMPVEMELTSPETLKCVTGETAEAASAALKSLYNEFCVRTLDHRED